MTITNQSEHKNLNVRYAGKFIDIHGKTCTYTEQTVSTTTMFGKYGSFYN